MSDLEYDDPMSDEGYDDIEMDDEADIGESFEPISTTAAKNSYQVDCQPLSPVDIADQQKKSVQEVSDVLGASTSDAAILLRHWAWNKEKVIERFMDAPDKCRADAGIQNDSAVQTRLKKRIRGFTCEICFDTDSSAESLALGCGHRYCKDCYIHYLDNKIRSEGESRRIQCMASNCKTIVDEKTIQMLLPKELYERYVNLLNRTYVDDDKTLRWCPAPGCDFAVRCRISLKSLDTTIPTVKCGNGHKFCFGCGLDDHQPCCCPIVKLWLKKCEDDSETANWISANTKECPECLATIEKNGGCNHMTCKKCKYEFCWVCMGRWSEHGTAYYNCSRFDEKKAAAAGDDKSQSRISLERYLHYYNRYANHEQSAKLESELYNRIEKKMLEMQKNSTLSWIEVQFLKNAVDTLSECRITLKWTYAMAFYMKRDNETEMFEDNQKDLEEAVESLSELLEMPIEAETIPDLRQKCTDKTVYVKKRHEIILQDSLAGYDEENRRWSFTIATST